jgi:hypothetical protein
LTDYLPYTAPEYAVDAPATALHFERWFRNWEAGFEGALGAPKLDLGALARLEPGEVIKSRLDTAISGSANTTLHVAYEFLQAGTVRVEYEHIQSTGSGHTSQIRRIRNGVSTTVSSIGTPGAWTARNVDVPVQPGDRLEVYLVANSGGAQHRNTRFKTTGGNLWPGVAAKIEGNSFA